LFVVSVFSLAILYQWFGTTLEVGTLVDWVEGIATITAILVAFVGLSNNWERQRRFNALNESREGHLIKVMRDGIERQITIQQVVVGDVVVLEQGDVVPCDGVFLSGNNISCDESGMTGDANAIAKASYEECVATRNGELAIDMSDRRGDNSQKIPSSMEWPYQKNCFAIGGSKVLEGKGTYLVLSVGKNSLNGRITLGLALFL
jgi:P-type Ca2+ transporter type 2C